MSRLTDWRDRNTCILFGDGSGAVVLRAGAPDSGPSGLLGFSMHRCVSRGVVGARLPSPPGLGASARHPVPGRTAGEPDRAAPCSNGGGYDNLRAPVEGGGEGEAKPFAAGPAARAGAGYAPVAMAGQEVFKFATRAVPQVLREAADRSGVALEDVDWFVLHQVSPPTKGSSEDCRGRLTHRTRPAARRTSGSWTRPRRRWGWTARRCSPTSRATATPPPLPSPSPSTRPSAPARCVPPLTPFRCCPGAGTQRGEV